MHTSINDVFIFNFFTRNYLSNKTIVDNLLLVSEFQCFLESYLCENREFVGLF